MAQLKQHKVVAALPSVLEPDSVYFVRVGSGVDLYVTNSSGTVVAYAANYQSTNENLTALAGLTGAAGQVPIFTGAGDMSLLDMSDSGWLTPTLVSSFGHGTDPLRYGRVGQFGIVTGLLRRNSPPSAVQNICTIPAGYRPDKVYSTPFLWVCDNLAGQLFAATISPGGVINTGLGYNISGTPSGAGGAAFSIVYKLG
jgi:hypothetical protein